MEGATSGENVGCVATALTLNDVEHVLAPCGLGWKNLSEEMTRKVDVPIFGFHGKGRIMELRREEMKKRAEKLSC